MKLRDVKKGQLFRFVNLNSEGRRNGIYQSEGVCGLGCCIMAYHKETQRSYGYGFDYEVVLDGVCLRKLKREKKNFSSSS